VRSALLILAHALADRLLTCQCPDKQYCIYPTAHGDYTYSETWVNRLVEEITDNRKFAAIKQVKL
jgi:hypothetical protein